MRNRLSEMCYRKISIATLQEETSQAPHLNDEIYLLLQEKKVET